MDPTAPSSNAEIIELGRKFVAALEGRAYRCKICSTHLALADDIVTRAFHCQSGKAYLFNNALNITVGPHEQRMMLSGMHTVADIYCCCCKQIVGWKYVAVDHDSQKYKEGKFVLERYQMPVTLVGLLLSLALWDVFKYCGDRWQLDRYPVLRQTLVRVAQCATSVILFFANVQVALLCALAVSYAVLVLHSSFRKLTPTKQSAQSDGNSRSSRR